MLCQTIQTLNSTPYTHTNILPGIIPSSNFLRRWYARSSHHNMKYYYYLYHKNMYLKRNADRSRVPYGLKQLRLVLEGDVHRPQHGRADTRLGKRARPGLLGEVRVGLPCKTARDSQTANPKKKNGGGTRGGRTGAGAERKSQSPSSNLNFHSL